MLLSWYDKIRDSILKVLEIFSCLLLIVVLTMVVLEAVLRTLFGISSPYLVELPRLLTAYFTFLFVGPALKKGKHISAGLIPENINPFANKIINLLIHVIMIYASYLILKVSISLIEFHISTNAGTYTAEPIPMWVFSSSCIVGLGLSFLLCIEMMIQDIVAIIKIHNTAEIK